MKFFPFYGVDFAIQELFFSSQRTFLRSRRRSRKRAVRRWRRYARRTAFAKNGTFSTTCACHGNSRDFARFGVFLSALCLARLCRPVRLNPDVARRNPRWFFRRKTIRQTADQMACLDVCVVAGVGWHLAVVVLMLVRAKFIFTTQYFVGLA